MTRSSSMTPAASASSWTSRAASRTPSSSKASRSSRTSIIAAPAAARSTPATAPASCCRCRTPSSRRWPRKRAHQPARARPVRRRQHLHAAQCDAAPQDRRVFEQSRAGRRPDRISAGAPCRPTTPARRHRQGLASRSCARCSSAAARRRSTRREFERKLYVIRKRAYNEIRMSTHRRRGVLVHRVSLSHKTLVYKGMLTDRAARPVLPRPAEPADGDGARAGALALQHQHVPELGPRASVPLHRAQRRDQHAARQHQLDARARGAVRVATLFGDDIKKILPIINPNGSDSAMFDNALELLVLAGRSLPHAMMMMIPEPWSKHESMDPTRSGVLRVPLVSDGAVGRPGVHRLHRRQAHRRGARSQRPAPVALLRHQGRPGRHGVAKPACSTFPPEHIVRKGRLQPGRMFLVDTEQGRIVDDEEIKAQIANERPYRRVAEASTWCISRICRRRPELPSPITTRCCKRQLAFGYTFEDQRIAHGADGARRRRSRRLDGQRHAARGALEQAAPALRLLQAAVRAGHQPADRLHPRGDHHLGGDAARLGRQPARSAARATAAASSCKWPILTNEEFAKLRRMDRCRASRSARCRSCSAPTRGEKGLVEADGRDLRRWRGA